jgi:hypothetical protein
MIGPSTGVADYSSFLSIDLSYKNISFNIILIFEFCCCGDVLQLILEEL